MKTIDEQRLEANLAYRFEYLAEFIGFDASDAAAVQASGPYLGPLIPEIVERTYDKLLAYDATARHFLPRQSGYDGPVPSGPTGPTGITATHPQIQFRKEHLLRYFMQILGRNCDAKILPYFDMVGKIHTPRAGNPEIDVPLVQMNALMGFLSDVLMELISSLPMDASTALQTMRAFNKLLWIQNDFISRHYQNGSESAECEGPRGKTPLVTCFTRLSTRSFTAIFSPRRNSHRSSTAARRVEPKEHFR